MIKVYSPRDQIEAECLRVLLISHHIHCHTGGTYLQGAVGELPAHDLIGLYVDIADADRAREMIDDWMKARPVIEG